MKLPAWMMKLAAAAVIPVAVGVGVAVSAPSPVTTERAVVTDQEFTPGNDGVDYAAITGPLPPKHANAVPACADPERRGDLRPC